MSNRTGIQWTDCTWNVVTGCTRVSDGCDHCYAFQLHDQRFAAWKTGRFPNAAFQYHRPFSQVQLLEYRLNDPFRWKTPRLVFVNSMADLFHLDVPDPYIRRVFDVMAATPRHTYQILTKRPERMQHWCAHFQRDPLPNVWLGTSAEDQPTADMRIDYLIHTPAAIHFLSLEPLLGPITLRRWLKQRYAPAHAADSWAFAYPGEHPLRQPIQWVIVGGESGPHARPVDARWVDQLNTECIHGEVPFFFKQWGGRTPKAGGRELNGRIWDQMPEREQAVVAVGGG